MPGEERSWSFGRLHLHLQNDLQPDLPGFISRKLRNGFWISGSFIPSIQICSEISFLAVCSWCSEEPLQGLEGRRCSRDSQRELTYLDSPQGLMAGEVPQSGCPVLLPPLLVAKACSTTLNDSDSVAKAFNGAGNGHPSSHFFIQVFSPLKDTLCFQSFPSLLVWIWNESELKALVEWLCSQP